jgi:hypothetical protein
MKPVHSMLHASAVIAYSRGSEDIGEVFRPDTAKALPVALDVNGHVLSGDPASYAPLGDNPPVTGPEGQGPRGG